MNQNQKPGADVRSAPTGALLPPTTLPAGRKAGPAQPYTTAPRAPRVIEHRPRSGDRARLYDLLRVRAGQVVSSVDASEALRIERKVAAQQLNVLYGMHEQYVGVSKVGVGSYVYRDPEDAPSLPVEAPEALAPALPPTVAPAAPTAPQGCPDEMLVQCLRPLPGGWLVVDEDTSVTYVLRRATAADHKESSP